MADDVTRLSDEATAGLGSLEVHHPPGTFAPTPATMISLEAIGRHQSRFGGIGLDWGSGSGVLAIAAARIPAVDVVIGLELEEANVRASLENAERNAVASKVSFFRSDSYEPFETRGRQALHSVEGMVDFILANPPSSSPEGDGFEFRRAVVRGAGPYLKVGGVICLAVSWQYGLSRVMGLLDLDPTLDYAGVLASSDWVPFDMGRPDLRECVAIYAAEENRGGLKYPFRHPEDPERELSAREVQEIYVARGLSALSRWQCHLFVRARSPRQR